MEMECGRVLVGYFYMAQLISIFPAFSGRRDLGGGCGLWVVGGLNHQCSQATWPPHAQPIIQFRKV